MVELAGAMNYRFASASLQGAAKNPWDTSCWTCGRLQDRARSWRRGLRRSRSAPRLWGSIICPSRFAESAGYGRPTGALAATGRWHSRPRWTRSDRWRGRQRIARGFSRCSRDTIPRITRRCPSTSRVHVLPVDGIEEQVADRGLAYQRMENAGPECGENCRCHRESFTKDVPVVHHVALPQGPWDDAGNVTMGIEGAASFRSLIRSGQVTELADPLGQINGYVNEQISGADYLPSPTCPRNSAEENGGLV